jgi:hypothetical protein
MFGSRPTIGVFCPIALLLLVLGVFVSLLLLVLLFSLFPCFAEIF